MKFSHRLAYYLFGVLIGAMALVFFLKNKKAEFCYLPNCRVLKTLRSKGMEIGDEAKKKLSEKWVTMEDIKNCTTHGDVDFGKSNKFYKGGKLYVVEGKNLNNEPIIVEMVNFENKVLLKDVRKL